MSERRSAKFLWVLAITIGLLLAAGSVFAYRTVYFGHLVEYGEVTFNPNEDIMLYNSIRWASMKNPGDQVNATVIHSLGQLNFSLYWAPVQTRHSDITMSSSATKPVTYASLVATGADVIIIGNAWHGPPDQTPPPNPGGEDWSYSAAEIADIEKYLKEGHGFIITAGSFGQFAKNTLNGNRNYNMHTLMGIKSTGGGTPAYADAFPWSRNTSPYPANRAISTVKVDDTTHPIVQGVPSSFGASIGYGGVVSQWMATDGAVQVAHYADATFDYTDSLILAYENNAPPTVVTGGPYTQECNGHPTTVQLDGTGSSDPDLDPLTFAWTTTCSGGSFDNAASPTPVLSVPGPPPCSTTCDVTLTVSDGNGGSATDTTTVTVQDSTAPVFDARLEHLDPADDSPDGLFRVVATANDACGTAMSPTAFVDVYGTGATCDDETPGFLGYPVKDGEVIQTKCAAQVRCSASDGTSDEDSDETPDGAGSPVVKISGPAIKIVVSAPDDCGNADTGEIIHRCPAPDKGIDAITLVNSVGVSQTFYWYEFGRNVTTFVVGGETAVIPTDSSLCVAVGQQYGTTLTVGCIQAGQKLEQRCRVPRGTLGAPCP